MLIVILEIKIITSRSSYVAFIASNSIPSQILHRKSIFFFFFSNNDLLKFFSSRLKIFLIHFSNRSVIVCMREIFWVKVRVYGCNHRNNFLQNNRNNRIRPQAMCGFWSPMALPVWNFNLVLWYLFTPGHVARWRSDYDAVTKPRRAWGHPAIFCSALHWCK